MNLEQIFAENRGVQSVIDNTQQVTRQLVTGLLSSAKILFLGNLLKKQAQPILVVTDSLAKAERLFNDLNEDSFDYETYWFPAEEIMAAEVATSSPDYRMQRVEFLHALAHNKPALYVTSVSGMRRLVANQKTVLDAEITLAVGQEYDLTKLAEELIQMGYQRQSQVEKKGQFAMRGSILDIFPLTSDTPVRLDFFDVEIDSMRTFDATTQRSLENIEDIQILPASDLIINQPELQEAQARLQAELADAKKRLDDEEFEQVTINVNEVLDRWQKFQIEPSDARYLKELYSSKNTILNYIEDGVLVVDDYPRILEAQADIETNESQWIEDQLEAHLLMDGNPLGVDIKDLIKQKGLAQVFLAMFKKGMGNLKFDSLTEIGTRSVSDFFGQMPTLKSEMDHWQSHQQTVVVMANSKERQAKITTTLNDFKMPANARDIDQIEVGKTNVLSHPLMQGFEMPSTKLVVLTEKELFAKPPKKKARPQNLENAERLKSYTELKKGDYVVHVNHGIGRYLGMTTMEVDGVHQDYMTIQYKGSGQLFIPVSQLNLVQKYVTSEGKSPKLNRLGGADWAKTKQHVASKVEDIADDLIDLYAKRSAQKGFAFKPDDDYQRQFDADFPYSETPDQLRSIEEIKHDMEQPKPMDRLLVGDVGYGKTEVALRAAFKAVESSKQVAILVPTTILAQQHYDTMKERFDGYPISIGILSRFQTNAQAKEVLEQLADGTLDVVVGTHRLLSKDVEFKDLGLLVIDEEQRFGVKHKERIKSMRSQVDVLTLTATPIPRTLNMSMIGVRDLSVIETPPTNRYPIQTYVMEENASAIREGIQREMRRNGQAFYLHNRVSDIEKVVSELQALVPEARVGYIHGQMSENQLEDILYDFIQGEYDVLVTTTIIETGIDIPNANTLFVENADKMGLSQLYQLRGRIGRSSRVAYAYFLYQKNRVLTELGEKRLEAIKDFTELGSGFKIAMRDLAIRGAGNILGKQQHGFINSVGYDLYTQMLSDAVSKKQGKTQEVTYDSEISLGMEAYLPDQYINDEKPKIEFYKRLRQVKDEEQVDDIAGDMMDRFGEYPVEVDNLLKVTTLKLHADRAQIEKIDRNDQILMVMLTKSASKKLTGEKIFEALSVTKLKATVKQVDDKMLIKLMIQPNMQDSDWFKELLNYVIKLEEYL